MKSIDKMNTSSSSKDFDDYLKKNRSIKGESYSHTKIGCKESNIYAGSYLINDLDVFWNNYYNHVFVNNNKEYLTEKQLKEDGPLLIDIDLRYEKTVTSRQHNDDHIIDLINLYATKLNVLYKIPDATKIDVYVSQKPNVNILDDKTKDGIHLVFTIKMTKAEQCVLRKLVFEDLKVMWSSLPLTNEIEDMIDEGITKGFVNWQVYGSQKPNNERYELTNYFTLTYDAEDDIWDYNQNNIKTSFNIKDHLPIMSARNNNHTNYELTDNKTILSLLNVEKNDINNKAKKSLANSFNNNNNNNKIDLDNYDFSKISNMQELDKLINNFLENLSYNDYELKELHSFVMILPSSYYAENSYNKWIRVGWALKNTNEKLFLSWLKLSSLYKKFDFRDVSKFYNMWNSFEIKNVDGLTNRSIMYWAKTDNLTQYNKIRQETISYYIDQTLETMIKKDKVAEYDLAVVLYQLCKDNFVCISVSNNKWYEYKNNIWKENDNGNSLRLIISRKMHDIYVKKSDELIKKISQLDNEDQSSESLKTKSSKIGDICILLKTTSWKSSIMKESRDLFYDPDFIEKLDSNPYLLSFNNYVIDFKNKLYRKGKPDDYISKSTKIDYIPYKNLTGICNHPNAQSCSYEDIIAQINKFINELFPNEELCNYMWEHLASVLIGTNDNQTFNIYNGSGCNGKSKLVELMGKCLGDYKGTVPITLITQKRNNIGGTSSEIVQLQGIRYAVMQEPSKGDKINEGIMKEITGGDPIQGRALFKETITFIPQFKLVVCTNVLFDINTNDDGTWRRIRLCDFMSKFNEAPYQDEDKFPRSNFPYQFLIDKKIDEKFDVWAPVFASMLVDLAFKTQGKVKDAKIVTSISDKYREAQDYLTEFSKEKIVRKRDGKIKKTEILEEFKNWYIMHYGRNNIPNGKEITDYMDKNYGKCNRGKWFNVEINYENDSDDEDITNND